MCRVVLAWLSLIPLALFLGCNSRGTATPAIPDAAASAAGYDAFAMDEPSSMDVAIDAVSSDTIVWDTMVVISRESDAAAASDTSVRVDAPVDAVVDRGGGDGAAGSESDTASGGSDASSVPSSPDGLSLSGTVAHGSIVTITDWSARFGNRTNVKPLYVSLGDQRQGNGLGRKTGDYYHVHSEASNVQTVGAISQTLRFDFKGTETANAIWGNEIFFTEDPSRPLLQYLERYYDFDIYQPQYQHLNQFNLKTNRLWGNWNLDPNVCNLYVGYNGSWQDPETSAVATEHTSEGTVWMSTKAEAFQWLSEEYVFKNSSAPDAADGILEFYRNNTLQNAKRTRFVTYTTAMRQPLTMVFFDQVSNGNGDGVAHTYEYLGYINLDDEYRRAYLSASATRAPGSKLIPMIQTAWSPNTIRVQLVHSQVPLSGSYLHIRLGKDTWLEPIRLP
jgi:hypothetical protein